MNSKNFVICLIIIAAYRALSVYGDKVQIVQHQSDRMGYASSSRAFVPSAAGVVAKAKIYNNCRKIRHPFIEMKCQPTSLIERQIIKGEILSFSKIRKSIIRSYKKIPYERRSIVKSMIWGDLVFDSVFNDFKSLGLLHLFSVSGLHVNFVFAIVVMITRIFTFVLKSLFYLPGLWIFVERNSLVRFLSLAGVWLYVGLCEFKPPSVRAFLVLFMASLLLRPGSKLLRIMSAFAVQVAWNPDSLFSTSFGLSWSIFILLAGQTWKFKDLPVLSLFKLQVIIYFLGYYWLGIQSLNSIFFNLLFLPLASILFYTVLVYSLTFNWTDFFGPLLEGFLFLISKAATFGANVKTLDNSFVYQALASFEPGLSAILIVIILNSLRNMAKTDRELVMNHEG